MGALDIEIIGMRNERHLVTFQGPIRLSAFTSRNCIFGNRVFASYPLKLLGGRVFRIAWSPAKPARSAKIVKPRATARIKSGPLARGQRAGNLPFYPRNTREIARNAIPACSRPRNGILLLFRRGCRDQRVPVSEPHALTAKMTPQSGDTLLSKALLRQLRGWRARSYIGLTWNITYLYLMRLIFPHFPAKGAAFCLFAFSRNTK